MELFVYEDTIEQILLFNYEPEVELHIHTYIWRKEDVRMM